MLKDKNFLRAMLAIALPIALQNMIGMAVNIADNVMVGSLGDVALSGVSLAGQPFFFLMIIGFGCASGGAVLISQYWGKKNIAAIRSIMGIVYRIMMILSVIFGFVCFMFPTFIMSLLTDEQAVIESGAAYLKVAAVSYPLFAFSSAYVSSIRAVEKVKLATVNSLVALFVNIFFNYIFIYGKLGMPAMGVVGAALGTVVARVFDVSIVIVYMLFIEKDIKFRPHHIFVGNRVLFADYMKHALPVVCSEFCWSLGTVILNGMVGHLGSVFIAANSITGNVQQLAMTALYGVGNAGAVLTGKTIGEGDIVKARKMAKSLIVLGLAVATVGAGLVLILREFVPGFFNVSAEAKELAYQMMAVLCLFVYFQALDYTTLISILRGSGDTKFGFFADAGMLWLVGLPVAYCACFVWNLPQPIIYLLLRCDSPVKIALCLVRIIRGNYIKIVTRESENINNLTSAE